MKIESFKGCEATINFILKLDGLFDILNSRSPWVRGFKSPLRLSNEATWRPFLLQSTTYLLGCIDISERPLWMAPKKTPFVGLAITAMSICGVFDDFIQTRKMNYILTYKFSQDHLETFFSSVRSVFFGMKCFVFILCHIKLFFDNSMIFLQKPKWLEQQSILFTVHENISEVAFAFKNKWTRWQL